MSGTIITGTGLYTPEDSITNAELVESLAVAVERFNRDNADAIAAGRLEERDLPTERFILKASGIEHRYVVDKRGVLDPERLRPRLPLRGEDELSIQCEMALAAVRPALEEAGRRPQDVDAVLVACSNLQRAYPAVAIEVQNALGASGWAYDLNVACSSATFGIQAAVDAVRNGNARCAVVVNPEITSGHTNFVLRDYHFIFGDACTAVVVESTERAERGFEVLGTRLQTKFSNNIRNDFGFLNSSEDGERDPHELLFRQNGRRVFREVCPMVADHILEHLTERDLQPADLKRLWLHQANLSMNQLISKTVLGRMPEPHEAPVILHRYANTSSAGSVIAFHEHRADLAAGDLGVLCSFGAGYSIGSVILRKSGA
ncbi:MAG: beta-ketoacyl-ACP synthase III [Proteobacteria bacterium]|nr:beta-ketoacyl-ACP synthase III [Pseudomonadota bacterium]MCZ6785244.1 beta-ketoacyl-ACP synthase III [Pseudomonadota bacterium]